MPSKCKNCYSEKSWTIAKSLPLLKLHLCPDIPFNLWYKKEEMESFWEWESHFFEFQNILSKGDIGRAYLGQLKGEVIFNQFPDID